MLINFARFVCVLGRSSSSMFDGFGVGNDMVYVKKTEYVNFVDRIVFFSSISRIRRATNSEQLLHESCLGISCFGYRFGT